MPPEKRFTEVRKLLEKNGWTLVRIHGSHHIFKKEGQSDFSIPVHRGKVKFAYVHKIQKAIKGK